MWKDNRRFKRRPSSKWFFVRSLTVAARTSVVSRMIRRSACQNATPRPIFGRGVDSTRPIVAGERRFDHLMNSISRYVGSGQRSSATIVFELVGGGADVVEGREDVARGMCLAWS